MLRSYPASSGARCWARSVVSPSGAAMSVNARRRPRVHLLVGVDAAHKDVGVSHGDRFGYWVPRSGGCTQALRSTAGMWGCSSSVMRNSTRRDSEPWSRVTSVSSSTL